MSKGEAIPFTTSELELIAHHLKQELGIVLQDNHSGLIYSHLKQRIAAHRLEDFSSYYERVLSNSERERQLVINLTTNNKTHFFREKIQLGYIRDTLLPEIELNASHEQKVRIWSAACSSGEEPYTLAMVLNDFFGEGWDISILASDVNTHVLAQASRGIYSADAVSAIPGEIRERYLIPLDERPGFFQVAPSIRKMVQFRQINLHDSQYSLIKTTFNLILCRNVTLYFDLPLIPPLLLRLHALLKREGHLALGIAESFHLPTKLFSKRRYNIYRPTIESPTTDQSSPLIVIGGSTGAVDALKRILQPLPANTAGIVAAIHMPNEYSGSFAERLNQQCTMEVTEASNGDTVSEGKVLICPGHLNILIHKEDDNRYAVTLSKPGKEDRFTPSIDQLFVSAGKAAGFHAIGVLLTGMGSDGAMGLLKMRQKHARTITQNEESCVVYGMPKAADELHASELSCHLNTIPQALRHAVHLVGKEAHSKHLQHWKRGEFGQLGLSQVASL